MCKLARLSFTLLYDKERDLDKLVSELKRDAVVFVKDVGKETGRFFKISKGTDGVIVKDHYWTVRQRGVLEKTLKSKRVLLTGALGSGKTLIAICRVVAAIERDPKKTLVLYWIVSARVGDGKDIKLFEKVRSAVAESLPVGLQGSLDLDEILDCRFVGINYTEWDRNEWLFISYKPIQDLLKKLVSKETSPGTSRFQNLCCVFDEYLVGDTLDTTVPNFLGSASTRLADFQDFESGSFNTKFQHDEVANVVSFRLKKLEEAMGSWQKSENREK